MAEITKETVEEIHHGHVVVGTNAVPVVGVDIKAYKGVLLRCPGPSDGDGMGNAVPVYVGGPSVTADKDAKTGGTAIPPGQSIVVPIERPFQKLFARASSPGQDLSWMLV